MNFIPNINDPINISKARELNPLVLAYIGDSVYSTYIRTYFSLTTNCKVNALNKEVTTYVKAEAQSKKMREIEPILTEEENDIFHRARNAHVNSVAKNASVIDYKYATAFEALIGYLYITGQKDRLEELIKV